LLTARFTAFCFCTTAGKAAEEKKEAEKSFRILPIVDSLGIYWQHSLRLSLAQCPTT
jgi:hypothetical protein